MPELNESVKAVKMPDRLKKLPINEKGFPIPEFVAWLAVDRQSYVPRRTHGAIRDFRVINPRHMDECYRFGRCWICNEPLGRHRVFAIGPMCAISRTTMEPPSHRECVEYATRTCPFMLRPKMVRNMKEMPEERHAPGLMIERNPGVYCLWETNSWKRFKAPGGLLCEIGEPTRVDWWAEGREATRAEIVASLESGLPLLMIAAKRDGPEAIKALNKQAQDIEKYLPA